MSMEARASFPYLLRFVRLLLATATALTPAVAMADMRARCNTAFDADYFYISADVEKPVLRGSVAAPFQDPLSDDAIVVGLALPGDAADRSAGVSPPASTKVEFAVSVAQGAQLYRGPDRRPLTGFDDFLTGPDGTRMLFKYRLRARGKLNAEPDFANGYSVEVAIPWIEMGGPPKPGDRMRFNVTLTNTVEGEPPVVSLSRAVTSREEMHDAAKWSEIVFVEAPTASVSGAPGALVCARVYNVKPIIDGASDDAEWTRITAFAFGAGAEAVGPLPGSAAAARSRAPSELKKVPPAPNDGKWLPPTAVAPTSRRQQDWPKLVFARYLVNRQADARKPLPSEPVSATDGRSLLITHPMDGTGPWFTYDRVDWHRIQLTRMREAGVDVAAVVFRPNRAGRLAVTALASALAALEASGADYPTACLWLDASGIKAAAPGVEPAANALYAAIREFHQCLPDRFAATVTLSKENGPGFAVPIVLAGLDSMRVNAGDVAPIRDALRVRFRAEHDRDLVVLATQPDGAWDGLVGDASATGYALGAGDRIRTAAIYAGAPGVPQGEHLLFRRARDTYRSAWRSAITDRAAWVFVDSWNDFAAACEIAPTVEYGLEYSDMTQAFSRAWRGHVEFGGHLVACTVPVSMRQGAGCAVRLTVRNTGVQTWQPGAVAILVSWNGARTRALAPIATPVEMGSLCHVTVQTPAAPSAGMHTCEVRAVRLDRAGAPMPPSPLTNALIAAVPVSVEPSDGPSIAQPATLIAVSPLRVAEGLSTHPVTLTVRNDGPQAWAQGTAILRARMFEQAPGGEPVLLDMADAAAPIAAQTLPGAEATLDVPITFARSDGTPFRLSEFGDTRYLLRWEIATDGAVQSAAILGCQEV
ncbi:MAG: hypothetical protein FJX72_15020, partial [Armatimonadetes bacterium]|nr:hypothetical protein [Armatimonadota bacterium]